MIIFGNYKKRCKQFLFGKMGSVIDYDGGIPVMQALPEKTNNSTLDERVS